MSSPFSKQRVKNVCLRRCGVTSKSIQRSTDPYRAFFVGSVFLLFTHSHIDLNDDRVIGLPSALAITNIDCDSAFSFLSSASSAGVIGRSRILQSVFRYSLSVELALLNTRFLRTRIIPSSKSTQSHLRPQISPRRIPVFSAIKTNGKALVSFKALSRTASCSLEIDAFFSPALPPGFKVSGTGDLTIRLLSTAESNIFRSVCRVFRFSSLDLPWERLEQPIQVCQEKRKKILDTATDNS